MEVDDCDSHDKKHADASVSKFALDAEVCFSIGNLMRIPTYLLTQQILGLIHPQG